MLLTFLEHKEIYDILNKLYIVVYIRYVDELRIKFYKQNKTDITDIAEDLNNVGRELRLT
jgi:CRISPR/Cas system CMR-associated protein Cmr3 (group 5 of RAMP superfamily)